MGTIRLMSHTSIEIDVDTFAALTDQAQAMGMTLDGYLRALAGGRAAARSNGDLSLTEFERLLDGLLADVAQIPALPAGFSRADIYGDHN